VLCFLSHRSLISSALAKYVYSKTFPSFAMDFDASMHELLEIGVLEAARPEAKILKSTPYKDLIL
jgi:hypothetical protein